MNNMPPNHFQFYLGMRQKHPAEPLLGFCVQRGGHPAGGTGLPEPSDGGRGHGAQLGQRDGQCTFAQALAFEEVMHRLGRGGQPVAQRLVFIASLRRALAALERCLRWN